MDPEERARLARTRLLQAKERYAMLGAQMQEDHAQRFNTIREDGATTVHTAFNLFPTSPELADQMVDAVGLCSYHRMLEPSAGLGALVQAAAAAQCEDITAIEIDNKLCGVLYHQGLAKRIACRDFLACTPEEFGLFDRIVMNPPFKMGLDIKHIMHARRFLKPDGLLGALCYNGVKQNKHLRPVCETWDVLPAGLFKQVGTNAQCVLVTLSA